MDILVHFGAPQAASENRALITLTMVTSEGHQVGMQATVNFALTPANALADIKLQARRALEAHIGRTLTAADRAFAIGGITQF